MPGRLELKHVEYFRAVMAAGTISGAAAPHGREVEAIFAAAGIHLSYACLVRFAESACALAEQGLGVALVDEFTVSGCSYPALTRLEVDWRAPFRIYLHHASQRPLSALGEHFSKLLAAYNTSA